MRGLHFTVPSPSGNAGDDVLAHATRDLLGQIGVTEWTCVNLRDHVTPGVVAHANEHDLIVVGGGGLFLADTNPNHVSGWQWKCPLDLLERFEKPLAVLAVGYNAFRGQQPFAPIFDRHVAALLDKAAVFSVRNSGSRTALAQRHGVCVETVQVCPCPSLLIQPRTRPVFEPDAPRRVGLQLAGDRVNLRIADLAGFETALAETIRGLRQRDLAPVFVDHNWNADSNLAALGARFPDIPRLDLATLWNRADVDRVLRQFRDLHAVIAMRGHGQMIPLGQGTPTISWISHDKLAWLLDDAGLSEWGIEVNDPDLATRTLALLDRIDETDDWQQAHAAAAERFRVAAGRTLASLRAVL